MPVENVFVIKHDAILPAEWEQFKGQDVKKIAGYDCGSMVVETSSNVFLYIHRSEVVQKYND